MQERITQVWLFVWCACGQRLLCPSLHRRRRGLLVAFHSRRLALHDILARTEVRFKPPIPIASDTFVPVTQKTLLRAGLASGIWFLHVVSEDTQGYLTRQADHYQTRIGTDPGVGIVLGKVINGSGTAVSNAVVSLNRGLMTVTTNSSGSYNLQTAIAGTWEATIKAAGYQTFVTSVTITAGGSTTLNATLTGAAK